MTSLILVLVLTQTGDAAQAQLLPREPAVELAEPVLRPEPGLLATQARVHRFLGALAGGVVGAAAPLALAPVFSCDATFGFAPPSCLTSAHAILALASPVLGVTGSMLGYLIAGGQPSAAAFGAVIPGAAAMLLAMMATTGLDPTVIDLWVPGTISGLSVLALSSALLLTWREDQVTTSEASADRVRVGTTLVVATGSTLVGLLAVGGLGAACSFCAEALVVASGVLLGGSAFVTWGVHRALGGRSSVAAPLLMLVVDALSLGLIAVAGWLPGSTNTASFEAARNGLAVAAAVAGTVIGATVVPMLLLEGFHSSAVGSARPSLRLGLAPVPGGGTLSAGLSW